MSLDARFRPALARRLGREPWPEWLPDVAYLLGAALATAATIVVLPFPASSTWWIGGALAGRSASSSHSALVRARSPTWTPPAGTSERSRVGGLLLPAPAALARCRAWASSTECDWREVALALRHRPRGSGSAGAASSSSSSLRSSTSIRRLLAPSQRGHDLVQLQLHGQRVLVLRALDEEHHQEGDDGGAGVDDELPGRPSSGTAARWRPTRSRRKRRSRTPGCCR